MLLNPRYRGLYIHGRVKKVRRRGKLTRIQADPSEIITVEMPEWRIVTDELWSAVQERFASRRTGTQPTRRRAADAAGPGCKYMLSGLGKCGECGRAIGVMNTKRGQTIIKAYGCTGHHLYGKAVCKASLRRSMEAVDAAIIDELQERILVPETRDAILEDVRDALERKLGEHIDASDLEERLREAKAAVKQLVKLGALAGEDSMAEIASELQLRTAQCRRLEHKLAVAKRAPTETAAMMADLERHAWERMLDLRTRLGEVDAMKRRWVFEALFETPLTFTPVQDPQKPRKCWAIKGIAQLPRFILGGDPNGIRTRVAGVKGRCPRPTGRWGLGLDA
jgi:site-specific DNA recombinase